MSKSERFNLLPYTEEIADMYITGISTKEITVRLRQRFGRPIIKWDVSKLIKTLNLTRSCSENTKNQINKSEKTCTICNLIFHPMAVGQIFCHICIPNGKAYSNYVNFGISQPQYNEILEKQHNACAICGASFDEQPRIVQFVNGKQFSRTRVNIDHNHTTNKARGLLCMRCNTGLGYIEK